MFYTTLCDYFCTTCGIISTQVTSQLSTDVLTTTASKRAIQRMAKATCGFIENKIGDKITSKLNSVEIPKALDFDQKSKQIPTKKIHITIKRQQVINKFR